MDKNDLNGEFSKEEMQMTDKYLKKILNTISHQGLQIETTVEFYLISEWLLLKKKTNAGKDIKKK